MSAPSSKKASIGWLTVRAVARTAAATFFRETTACGSFLRAKSLLKLQILFPANSLN
jgi:hypothetical protein